MSRHDTLVSPWVTLNENTEISVYGLGYDTSKVKLIIESAVAAQTNTIQLLPATDTSAIDMYYVTPSDDQYRIKLINKGGATTLYSEELVIGALPLVDLLGARGRAEQAHEDARNKAKSSMVTKGMLTCSLSPNPARDNIRMRITGTILHEPVRLVISNLLGETVRVMEIRTMEDIEIGLDGLPSGQYILRSSLIKSDFFNPVIIPFVIER